MKPKMAEIEEATVRHFQSFCARGQLDSYIFIFSIFSRIFELKMGGISMKR